MYLSFSLNMLYAQLPAGFTNELVTDLTGNGHTAILGSTTAAQTTDPIITNSNLSIENDSVDTPTCTDGIQNGDETGIDCGGSNCVPCAIICDRAIQFDGLDDLLTFSNNVTLSDDFTIEFWANLDPGISNRDQPMGNGTSQNINFYVSKARIYDGGDYIVANFVTLPNEWHHYTFVRDGNILKVLIDGVLDQTATTNWTADFTVSKLGTTFTFTGFTGFLEGRLDEIRLWNIARSDADISTFYNKSIEPSTNGLEAYWSFNETDGTQEITDLTNNGYIANLGTSSTTEATDPVIIDSNLAIENDCNIIYTYNNGWSPSDPNGISKLSNTIISENGNATINTNTNCNDIIVNPGASITINSDITLVTSLGMTLESSSTTYSSLILNGTIIGPIAYKRFVNSNSLGNDLISPPLVGETWTDFLNSGTNAADLLDNTAGIYAFGPFDKEVDWYVNYTSTTTADLVSGTGYRAATDIGTTLTFTGSVPTGPVYTSIIVQTEADTYPDWNLIGNPYPSYLNIAAFLNGAVGDNQTNWSILANTSGIYGYDGTASDGWDIITLANADNRLMTPGQGFLVAANDAFVDYDITFHPSMRAIGTDDDFIVGRDANALTFLKLNASTSAKDYTTQFYFNDNASQGLDPGYDGKILGSAPNFALYSHLVQDDNGLPMALQALNPLDLTNVVIPLGVNAVQGAQLTFSISDTTLPSSILVYLDDTVFNTSTLLNSGDYTLTPNVPLNGIGRFYLRVSNSTLSSPQNTLDAISINTNNADKTIIIIGELLEATRAHVYDIQGRLLTRIALQTNLTSQNIDASSLTTGIYIVELQSATGTRTKKVVIR
jgi:hypothetical protein